MSRHFMKKKSPNKLFNHTIFSRINLIAQFMNKNWWMFSYWATVRNCTVHFYFLSNCCMLWSCREKELSFYFLRVWLVGRRIKRRTTAQPAVEMHKPIRRGFALGESSGQWEKGAARIWKWCQLLGHLQRPNTTGSISPMWYDCVFSSLGSQISCFSVS